MVSLATQVGAVSLLSSSLYRLGCLSRSARLAAVAVHWQGEKQGTLASPTVYGERLEALARSF